MFKIMDKVSLAKYYVIDLKSEVTSFGRGNTYESFLADVAKNVLPLVSENEINVCAFRGLVSKEVGCIGDVVIDRKNARIIIDIHGMKTLTWNDINQEQCRMRKDKVIDHKKTVMLKRLITARYLYDTVMKENYVQEYQDNDEKRCKLYLKCIEKCDRFINDNRTLLNAWYGLDL